MDYYGDMDILVVTVPGSTHVLVAWDLQHHIRQTLYDQGFYWASWGPGIRVTYRTGRLRNEFTFQGTFKSLESDGGLQIIGVDRPFLVIEVADRGGYKYAREKAIESLMGSRGTTRFAIIVDLIQKTEISETDVDESFNMSDNTDDGEASGDENDSDEETDVAAESQHTNIVLSASRSNKRAAESDVDGNNIDKKRRAFSASPPPSESAIVEENSPSPKSPPSWDAAVTTSPKEYNMYSSIAMTVLTTRLIQHPTVPGKKQRICVPLIHKAEIWPAPPGPDVTFRFTWEDMNTKNYPPELRGRLFSVHFGWLHKILVKHFSGESEIPIMNEDDEDEVEAKWDDGCGEFRIYEDVDEGSVHDDDETASEDYGSDFSDYEDPSDDEDAPNNIENESPVPDDVFDENDENRFVDDEEALNILEEAEDGLPPRRHAADQFYDVDEFHDIEEESDDDEYKYQAPLGAGLEVILEEDEHMAEAEKLIDETEEFMVYMNELIAKSATCQQCIVDDARELLEA